MNMIRHIWRAPLLVVVAVALTVASLAVLPSPVYGNASWRYEFVDFDLGWESSTTADINDQRQVVGWYYRDDFHPYLWDDGRLTELGTLPGQPMSCVPADINNRTVIVGWCETVDWVFLPFRWERGVMTGLGTLGGQWTKALAINDRGDIIGYGYDTVGNIRPVLWRNGVPIDMGPGKSFADINNRGQIVGTTDFDDTSSAAIFDHGRVIRLTTLNSFVTAINSAGWVIGGAPDPGLAETSHFYLWRHGTQTDLGAFVPTDINDRGDILGYIEVWPGIPHPARWRDGQITDLTELGMLPGYGGRMNNRGDSIQSYPAGAYLLTRSR